ncbi:hypothetical protein CQA70_29405, partial [Klebsiella pneumoniae]
QRSGCSRQVFSVPWSTVPVLQREGHTRFALTAIDDLYAAGNGGDLAGHDQRSGCSRQVFSVPWSTVPVLQREGHTRFALTA